VKRFRIRVGRIYRSVPQVTGRAEKGHAECQVGKVFTHRSRTDEQKKQIGDLEIADKIRDSSTSRGTVALRPGEYELNLYALSEILPNKALKNLGPVTAQLRVRSIMTAIIGKNAADVASSKALIKFLQGPPSMPLSNQTA
jgi:hypothetical protein